MDKEQFQKSKQSINEIIEKAKSDPELSNKIKEDPLSIFKDHILGFDDKYDKQINELITAELNPSLKGIAMTNPAIFGVSGPCFACVVGFSGAAAAIFVGGVAAITGTPLGASLTASGVSITRLTAFILTGGLTIGSIVAWLCEDIGLCP